MEALITNDAVVLGLLCTIIAVVFATSSSKAKFWQKFYTYVPTVLLCYFIPSILNSAGVISGEKSELYKIASRYLLPASLVLLTINIDMPTIAKLGKKAVLTFLAGTAGVILGGPIALFAVSFLAPEIMEGTGNAEVWRGLSTIAGSWIGGSANQAAMKEVFNVDNTLFSIMITIDVIVANLWMAVLLWSASRSEKIDKWLKADASAIEEVRKKVVDYQDSIAKIPTTTDLVMIVAVAFGVTGLSHFGSDLIMPIMKVNEVWLKEWNLTAINSSFFWLVVIATTLGVALSFVPSIRKLEGAGASKIGSVLLYVLVTTVGMQMDVLAIFKNPMLFLIGLIWMLVHAIVIIGVARLIKAPTFFIAVGSQANIGGAASAPIVASAFHPALAPVGVLLAVLGYALGTYGALISAFIMEWVFHLK